MGGVSMRIAVSWWAIAVSCLVVCGGPVFGQPASEPTSLRFFAYDRGKGDVVVGVSGVKLLALRADGVEALGTTGGSGELAVTYDRLFTPGNLALLFCAPSVEVQCTSLRLDIPHLRGFAEYNVRVPHPEIIDRQPVGGHARKP